MRHRGLPATIFYPGLLCLTLGCQFAAPGASLITLAGVSPKELSGGDELEIEGNGLPEGKPARVAFHGDLFRPGTRTERDVEIVARTTTNSARSLSVTMTDDLRAAFTGKGNAAKHTTFRGSIEISFAPKKAGAAPIVGTLSDVVLDIDAPLVDETLQRQRDEDATASLAFLGISLHGNEIGPCCFVASAEGRSQAVGVAIGDRVVDLDGVSVRAPTDLVPSGESRVARLSYQRGGKGPVISREVDVQGFRSAAPRELGPAVGLVGFFGLWLLLSKTRLGRPLEWIAWWLAVRLRDADSVTLRSLRARAMRRDVHLGSLVGLPTHSGWNVLLVMGLVAMSALGTLAGLRVDWASTELDLSLWLLLQTVSVVWSAILARIGQGAHSTLSLLKTALMTALYQVPLLALTLTVVLETRSVRFVDIVSAEGALPFGSYCFQSPPLLLLTLLCIAALVPSVTATEGDDRANGRWMRMIHSMSHVIAGTFHLWSAALLIGLLSFGGYRVPFVDDTLQSTGHVWQIVGVVWWFVKATLLVVGVVLSRWIAGQVTIRETLPTMSKHGLGLVAVGLVGAAAWSYVVHRYALDWVENVAAWVLVAITFVAIAGAVTKAVQLARCHRTELLPNPWI